MEGPVGPPLVAPHDPDRPEPDGRVAGDRADVVDRGVDDDAVVPAVVDEVGGDDGDDLAAQPAAVDRGVEEDVDPRVPVHRVLLLGVLDEPPDGVPAAADEDGEAHARRVVAERPPGLGLAPPAAHLGQRPDPLEPADVVRGERHELDARTREDDRHRTSMSAAAAARPCASAGV